MVSAIGKMPEEFGLMRYQNAALSVATLCVTVVVIISSGQAQAVQRPFILWDKQGEQQYKEVPSEAGGVTVIAVRRASATAFCALYEPFEGGQQQAKFSSNGLALIG